MEKSVEYVNNYLCDMLLRMKFQKLFLQNKVVLKEKYEIKKVRAFFGDL